MNRIYLIIGFILWFPFIKGMDPDTVNLRTCLQLASERTHLNRQNDLAAAISSDKSKNLSSNWLPSVDIKAQAIYNSETVDFSDLLENLPVQISSLPLDQYKFWAEINQQIFDGGITRILKDIEKAGLQGEIYQTEVETHLLKTQVNQVYFSLLVTQNSADIIESSLQTLKTRMSTMKAGVENGLILSDNLLALEAEEISLVQKITEFKMLKKQLIRILSVLTDSVFAESSVFATPEIPSQFEQGIRPEVKNFDQQIKKLQLNEKLVARSDLPRVFAFSQLAYGRPGYNMVSRDFHTFYTIGAAMNWRFLNYGNLKRQQKILQSQQEMIDIRKESFDDQLQVQIESELSNMEKYDSLILQDSRIVDLRRRIAEISLSRMNNGTITSSDYLKDMNAEIQARLQLENHLILRRQADYNLLMIQGKLK